MIRDKKPLFVLVLTTLAVLVCVAFTPADTRAYDEKKCTRSVEKLKKHIKSYRGLKIKTLYKQVDKIDEKEGGWDAKELEAAVDPPFEDLKWTKKFIRYMNNMEEDCTK